LVVPVRVVGSVPAASVSIPVLLLLILLAGGLSGSGLQTVRINQVGGIASNILVETHPIGVADGIPLDPPSQRGMVGAVADVVETRFGIPSVSGEEDLVLHRGARGTP